VRRHHFERAARLDAVLSLARAAVTMGLLMSARDRSATHERSVASEDPGQRSWAVGMTGPEAVVQASALFGSVLQALFERGYSRKLEFEADETGERLAARAGYAPQAGASLLQTLRNRSYEGHRYSYWRTHPYFDERVSRARSRAARHKAATAVADDAAYRERTALFFASAAQRMRDDGQALYLYRRALQCEPRGPASYAAALELARFKRQRQGRDPVLRRPYAELIAAYDALIERAEREDPAWRDLPVAREERAALEHEREEAHPDYLAAVERRDVPTEILERFAQNFPADPRRAEIIYRLAVHHEMAGKPARALEHLSTLIAEGGAWADSAVTVVLRTLPQVDEMTDCCRWLSDSLAAGPDSVRARIAEAAGARVEALIAADFTLEAGSRFLAACPDSPWSGAVREKVAARAEAEYRNGRVQEGMHRYQEALDSYYAVLAYAPDSSNASEAQAAIDRIHRAAADD
jgi:predicted Zn-dependent protease